MFQLHLIILGLVALVLILATIALIVIKKRIEKKNEYADTEGLWLAVAIGYVVSGIILLIFIIMLAPFNPKYWIITPEAGTVTSIQTQTVLTGDDSSSQLTPRFVLTLDDETVVIMDDPRVQNVEVGDEINLNCTDEFVYSGTDKRNCILN